MEEKVGEEAGGARTEEVVADEDDEDEEDKEEAVEIAEVTEVGAELLLLDVEAEVEAVAPNDIEGMEAAEAEAADAESEGVTGERAGARAGSNGEGESDGTGEAERIGEETGLLVLALRALGGRRGLLAKSHFLAGTGDGDEADTGAEAVRMGEEAIANTGAASSFLGSLSSTGATTGSVTGATAAGVAGAAGEMGVALV